MPAGFFREVVLAEQLMRAEQIPQLCELRVELKVSHQRAAARDSASDEVVARAELRLRVDRALGILLAKTIRRGGRGSKSSSSTSKRGGASRGLPRSIDKHTAANLRELARVCLEDFDRYILSCKKSRKQPTRAGAMSMATPVAEPRAPSAQLTSRRAGDPPTRVVELANRFMSQVDVHIGSALLVSSSTVTGSRWQSQQLRGSVMVTQRLDVAQWLRLLQPGSMATEILVVAPFAIDDPAHLRALRRGWQGVVLPQMGGWILLYCGNRGRAMRLMFARVGLFLAACEGA